MKLYLGENIRNLRKSADLTQEQLAERLGVTYQSVSRWENGTSYPDLELIPAIANIFSVSTDTLLGIPEHIKDLKAREAVLALHQEALKEEIDVPAVNGLLRDIRRNYLDCPSIWRLWEKGNIRCFRHPEILPEVRLTVEAYLNISKNFYFRSEIIQMMAYAEDDSHIDDFLDKYATAIDLSKQTLLLKRYRIREEWEKLDAARKQNLFMLLNDICDSENYMIRRFPDDPGQTLELIRFQLKILNLFCGYESGEDRLVSGNGQPDIWAALRLRLGFRYAACHAAQNHPDEALAILEECASLLEEIRRIREVTDIPVSSPWLGDFVLKMDPFCRCYHPSDETEEYGTLLQNGFQHFETIVPSEYYAILTDRQEWAWFDPIRGDERYAQIVNRVKSLIQYREKQ